MAIPTLSVRVNKITREADDIYSYELVDPTGAALPGFSAGAHVDVHTPAGIVRQYSLANDARETHRYVVAVQREPQSRGGSKSLVDQVKEGDTITISAPRNNFPVDRAAGRHVLIAGGIGITPILAMTRQLAAANADYKLYYIARTPEKMAFQTVLKGKEFAGHIEFIFDGGDPSKGLDVKKLLATRADGAHVYCCGPTGLMNVVKEAAKQSFPEDAVHMEYFTAEPAMLEAGRRQNKSFKVKVKSSGKEFEVPADKSILDVLRANGFDLDSSCEEGICGTCATQVVKGEIEHRDLFLTEKAKREGKWMMICISRAKGDTLTIDL
ncbi:MAG: oxidoreductase [Alphaproteobacteria bacterium]|nr:oxidoreductase [Alphaproteobacteria bacterium]